MGLLDVKKAADFLALSPSTVRSFVLHKRIPYYKIGGSLRFSEEELRGFIEKGHRVPGTEQNS